MLFKLILLFTLVPLIELALLIKIGTYIGVTPTISIVVITGVTGALLAKLQGLQTLRKIQTDISNGILPTPELFNGLLILAGGLLLLTPGFITDTLGLLALIPFTRKWIKKVLRKKIEQMIGSQDIHFTSFHLK
jgi:UPF0716 protein FxsA